MAVNETVYGLKENWNIRNITGSGYGANVSDDEKLKIANFLNTEGLTPSSDTRLGCRLGNAVYKMVNTPTWTINGADGIFDKSIVFTAMSGRHCPFTTLRFITNVRPDTATDNHYPITELDSQTIDVVNWSFVTEGVSIDYGNSVTSYVLYKNDSAISEGNANKNYNIRWSPTPNYGTQQTGTYNRYYNLDYSRRNNTTFITQLPCRRIVLVPYVTCSTDTDSSVATVDLATYINTTKATKPRIISISVGAYAISSNSDVASSSNQRSVYTTYGLILHHTLDSLNGFYCDTPNSTSKTLINNNYFVPVCLSSPYIPIGGLINSGHNTSTKPSGIQGKSTNESNQFNVYVVVNCGDLAWNAWSGDGDGLTGKGEYLYCDATVYTDEQIIESVRRAVACFGMFFTDSGANAQTKTLDDSGMFLGTLVDGVGYGDYTEGTANREQPQFNWLNMGESPYNPDNPPTPPIDIPPSNPTTFNPVTLADGGLKRYVLDDTSMTNFGAELWNVINTSNPDELIQNQTLTNFLTNNPLDCVVSIKRFPLADMRQGAATNPMLGKVKIPNVVVYPFDSSSTILSCGTKKIPRFFNDFRDYLVQYELILPFCGTISLDSAAVTGNEIEVKYAIDYTTGTCTAWVLANTTDGKQVVVDSANGNCTIDIPLSGVQTATLTGQIYNANENLKTAKFNGIISGVTGAGSFIQDVKNRNTGGAIGTGAKIVNAVHDVKKMEWNIEHTEIPLKMVGASSGCNSFQIELVPRLTAYVPNVTSDYFESDYLHNVGAAVCDTTTIGNYSGYAEITNVDMSGFAATSTEKNMIATALAGGVYL